MTDDEAIPSRGCHPAGWVIPTRPPSLVMRAERVDGGWLLTWPDGTTQRLTEGEFDAAYVQIDPPMRKT